MDRIQKGDETARKIYNETLGESTGINRKGVQIYERPYLWRDDSPTTAKDTFTENFIPTPTLNTNETPKWKRILGISVIVLIIAVITVCWFVGVFNGW